jgi:hypothetical protein
MIDKNNCVEEIGERVGTKWNCKPYKPIGEAHIWVVS